MSLRLRHLRLRAETAKGRFGSDFSLSDGLVILRADNSRGKSTAVKSILFALGLERMVTPRSTDILTSAMRNELIFDGQTKQETPVLGSWVSLELEGSEGTVATVTRWVKDEQREPGLIQVAKGPVLSGGSGAQTTQDYFAGRPGAAANPRGFHRWLAEFIGWEMPQLPTRDGGVGQLYMEQVFPLLFVEQQRGWGGIQAQMPAFSGVSDVRRRAIEFLLDLEVGDLEVERQRLLTRQAELQSEWLTSVRAFQEGIAGQGLVAVGLPESLTVAWPLPDEPSVVQSVDDKWISADDLIARLKREGSQLRQRETDGTPAGTAEQDLGRLLEEADSQREADSALRNEIIRDRDELKALAGRLSALREDLREHQDLVTLEKLGSTELESLHDDCPVCHQRLPASLLGGDLQVKTLSPADTVAYIRSQVELFETMQRDGDRAMRAKLERLSALREKAGEVRSQIRALRIELIGPAAGPSAQDIARRIKIEDQIERLESVEERFLQLLADLEKLASAGKEVRAALKALPKDRLAPADVAKLGALERSFLSQLQDYDFGSFSIQETGSDTTSESQLSISKDDYLPRREDWDLQANISASDSIRVVWAYLLGSLRSRMHFQRTILGFWRSTSRGSKARRRFLSQRCWRGRARTPTDRRSSSRPRRSSGPFARCSTGYRISFMRWTAICSSPSATSCLLGV